MERERYLFILFRIVGVFVSLLGRKSRELYRIVIGYLLKVDFSFICNLYLYVF